MGTPHDVEKNDKNVAIDEKQLQRLQAYYDGELSRFARWRMERQLRGSPTLRAELAELRELSEWMQEIDDEESGGPLPDFWSEIGPALSQVDRDSGRAQSSLATPSGMSWTWRPLATFAAVAVLLVAVLSLGGGPTLLGGPSGGGAEVSVGQGSLRYLNTSGVSYVVAKDSDDVTIIWLMDAPDQAEGA